MRSFYFAIPAMLFLLAGKSSYAQCGSVDLAEGKPATASSFDNNLFGFLGPQPPANAFDGSNGTIWASNGTGTQFIYVDLGTTINVCTVNLTWSILGTGRNFTIATSNDATTWTQRAAINNNTNTTNTIPVTGAGRYVRLQITTGNGTEYILGSMQVMGVTGCNSTNAAQGKTTSASTSRSGFPPSAAVDGNTNTAWRSSNSDNQTLTVDMGSLQNICSVGLTFDPADYGVNYTVQFSPDNASYSTAATVVGNNATTNNLVTTGTARYVRFAGTGSAAGNGYAIDEISVSNPIVTLPIKLVNFTATNIGNQQVQLKWTTEMETNNKVFLIQRSADGENYTTIGQVPGAINSSTALNYEWTDASPIKASNYYRLQQVDLDGNSSFSNVVVVSLTAQATLSAYPNPVKDILTIINPKGLTIREVTVYNTSGVALAKAAPSPTGTVQLSTSTWASGLYLVKVVTNEGTQVIKVMK